MSAFLKSFGLTALLGAALLVSAGQIHLPAAHAAQNTSGGSSQQACEESGFMWSSRLKKCANKSCVAYGQSYGPGSSRLGPPILGMKRVWKWCDGFTGKWETIR